MVRGKRGLIRVTELIQLTPNGLEGGGMERDAAQNSHRKQTTSGEVILTPWISIGLGLLNDTYDLHAILRIQKRVKSRNRKITQRSRMMEV